MSDFLEAGFSLQLIMKGPTISGQGCLSLVHISSFLLTKQEGASLETLTVMALEKEDSKEEGRHLWSCEGQAAEAKGFIREEKKKKN